MRPLTSKNLAICAQQRNLLSILDGNQSHTQEQPHILITSLNLQSLGLSKLKSLSS